MKERSLKDLFHRVKQVLPDEQELLMFPPEKPVIEALTVMLKGNFAQIPVVQGNEVLGVFSYRSFIEKLMKLPAKEKEPLHLPVEDFLEDIKFAQITDELAALFDEFDLKDAVLIGSEDRLQGIITTIDVLRYFYQVASPFVLFGEIELAIRELIRASLDENDFKKCINKSLRKHYEDTKRSMPSCLEEMTFHDYVMLLRYQDTWDKFKSVFGGSSNTTYARLSRLPDLRNDIFHFRREITIEEYDLLRGVRDWLLKRVRNLEATIKRVKQNE